MADMRHLILAALLTILPAAAYAERADLFINGAPVSPTNPLPTGGGSSELPSHVTIDGPDGPEGGVSVSINPFRKDPTVFSGTITVGGAWQQIAPANALRQRFFLQNYCSAAVQGIASTESLFIVIRGSIPTTTPLEGPNGTELVTCGAYDTSSALVSVSQVWVWAATTGHRFQALEW